MRDRRQELVLQTVRILSRAVEARVVNGNPRAVREVLGERKLLLTVSTARLGGDECYDAERTPLRDERREDGGRESNVAHNL